MMRVFDDNRSFWEDDKIIEGVSDRFPGQSIPRFAANLLGSRPRSTKSSTPTAAHPASQTASSRQSRPPRLKSSASEVSQLTTKRGNKSAPKGRAEIPIRIHDAVGVGYVPATLIPRGARGDRDFQDKVTQVAKKYNVAEDDLYRIMHFETGGTFKPDQIGEGNPHVIGLIQFDYRKGSWASNHGLNKEKLANMSKSEQMDIVDRYFDYWGISKIKNPTIDDLYTAVFAPSFAKKPTNAELPREYAGENRSLDVNKDGRLFKYEIGDGIRRRRLKGMGYYRQPVEPQPAKSPSRPNPSPGKSAIPRLKRGSVSQPRAMDGLGSSFGIALNPAYQAGAFLGRRFGEWLRSDQ